jgi:hypothetical protein
MQRLLTILRDQHLDIVSRQPMIEPVDEDWFV